ncbi:unnamed protein product [Phyllotreta striolata]|uniref:Beta-1,4-mannosyl-glycoprotein 4-beta-N-acetylglucosaminyltransferase n=1 Tax=Phyllotreta striolata TaxID=444603 RepID=A0A9P0GRY0_PHYSR|nr:unnamed protein product [Phyllotreta striolata]
MYIFRLSLKRRISVCVLITCQVFLMLIYFYAQFEPNKETSEGNGIKFLQNSEEFGDQRATYHTSKSNIILKTASTRRNFVDFNSSLCFKNGTDLPSMKINRAKWKCNCLPGWHGNDCGFPEVLWRAVLASKKPVKIKGPRTFERRLIYLFKIDRFSEYIADIRINDLGSIVDLFILYEDDTSDYLRRKLDADFCKEYQHKILYAKSDGTNLWKRLKGYLKNLRNDDIVLSSDSNEIPNRDALIFLKFYDQWPQPVKFRYRWSVFGFYWMHPSKTITGGGACTVSFLKESFNNDVKLLNDNKTLSSPAYKGLTLGDLNHYGGWYCEYCNNPAEIVQFLASKPTNVINWNRIEHQKVDNNYIEDLIENGVYVDGKTELKKAHKYKDMYFAPKFVMEHDWKYDFLLINFYSKADYYDI